MYYTLFTNFFTLSIIPYLSQRLQADLDRELFFKFLDKPSIHHARHASLRQSTWSLALFRFVLPESTVTSSFGRCQNDLHSSCSSWFRIRPILTFSSLMNKCDHLRFHDIHCSFTSFLQGFCHLRKDNSYCDKPMSHSIHLTILSCDFEFRSP